MKTYSEDSGPTKTFGTLHIKTPHVVWGDMETPIEDGERVACRTIHLVSGTVQICYDNGVNLNIEGPTKIKISRLDHCFLYSGSVLAQVSPSGVGFTVDTYSASIEDHGTEFGVYVQDENNSAVRVINGHVEVRPAGDDVSIHLTTGRQIRFSDVYPEVDGSQAKETGDPSIPPSPITCELVRTTSDGQGKEACIEFGERNESSGSSLESKLETLIRVENANIRASYRHRKAYFAIDLSSVPTSTFLDAVLEMAFVCSGTGLESPPLRHTLFSVYGLLDENGDYWKEQEINWENAPANMPGATEVDLNRAMMIGQIEIMPSKDHCIKRISGNALRKFIESDTNNLLTFIVVCETPQNAEYVYAFASRRHPGLPPPTLRLSQSKKRGLTDSDSVECPMNKL